MLLCYQDDKLDNGPHPVFPQPFTIAPKYFDGNWLIDNKCSKSRIYTWDEYLLSFYDTHQGNTASQFSSN
jgi:hypothetical protein